MKNPGYLPYLKIVRCSDKKQQFLLGLIKERLEESGIRTALFKSGEAEMLSRALDTESLSRRYDLVMVDTPCDIDGGVLVFGDSDLQGMVSGEPNIFFCRDGSDINCCSQNIFDWLMSCMLRTPILGCIMIGGKSSRMGHPKHLIRDEKNRTWLECIMSRLRPHVTDIVISGKGQIPHGMEAVRRVADLSGVGGPMAGIGAVMERCPLSSLVITACDMPDITSESIKWLLARRRPGRAAVIPHNREAGWSEPLFAWYDFRCGPYISQLIAEGTFGLHNLCRYSNVYEPEIPEKFCAAWRNVNRPEELG